MIESTAPDNTSNNTMSPFDPLPRDAAPVRFAVGSAKSTNSWSVDSSCLAPPKRILIGGSFKTRYKKYLESLLIHSGEDPHMEAVMEMAVLRVRFMSHGCPIAVTSGAFVRLLPSIVEQLNAFFLTYANVIEAVSTMVSGGLTPQLNEPQVGI